MKVINRTTFSVCKNKVTIKQWEDKTFDFVITDSSGKSYSFMNEENIEQVKNDLHEIADNNDIGAELSTKAHDWYYGKVLGHDVENKYDCM